MCTGHALASEACWFPCEGWCARGWVGLEKHLKGGGEHWVGSPDFISLVNYQLVLEFSLVG